MAELLEKLNWKGQNEILVLNAPDNLVLQLPAEHPPLLLSRPDELETISFLLAFVQKPEDITALLPLLQTKCPGDPVLWFAYPKKSSKQLKSQITRDSGWEALATIGLRPVRQIAIDEDWSALRFRYQTYVKTDRA